MGKKVAKVVTAPVKAVGKVAETVVKPVVKAVSPDKPKAPTPEPAPRQIQGRDTAAERAAARRKARMQGGGLLSGVSYIGSQSGTGGLPQLGETGLGIRSSDLGYPPEV